MNELIMRDENVPAIADDFLIAIADQAEKRVDAVMKIKKVALKVTNARDWTDQNGNPYLQVSGSEKIANLFNISWRIDAPICEEEPDGHFTYSVKGEFSLGGRTIEVEGTRSSKDSFFNRYDYAAPKVNGKAPVLPPSAIDKGDVKKAALTNLYGNGITRILGIRNLTWADLEEYAGIKKDDCSKIDYNKKNSGKPEVNPPQSKSKQSETQAEYFPRIKAALDTLHGNDTEAKKALIKKESTIPAKGDYPEKEGVEDYRTLDGKRLEILAHKIEKLAEKAAPAKEEKPPEICNECHEPIINGFCRNLSCPEGRPADE